MLGRGMRVAAAGVIPAGGCVLAVPGWGLARPRGRSVSGQAAARGRGGINYYVEPRSR